MLRCYLFFWENVTGVEIATNSRLSRTRHTKPPDRGCRSGGSRDDGTCPPIGAGGTCRRQVPMVGDGHARLDAGGAPITP